MTQTPNSSPSETQRAADVTPPRGTPNEDAASQRETGDDIRDPEKKRLSEEAASHRKRAKELEAQLKVYQDAEQAKKDAELSASELAKKQNTELNEQMEAIAAELAEARVRQAVADHADKFNFIVKARTLANLLLVDFDSIEFEDGKPTNIEKLLGKLAKAEPDLVKPEQTPGVPQARQAFVQASQGQARPSPVCLAVSQCWSVCRPRTRCYQSQQVRDWQVSEL